MHETPLKQDWTLEECQELAQREQGALTAALDALKQDTAEIDKPSLTKDEWLAFKEKLANTPEHPCTSILQQAGFRKLMELADLP